MVLLGLPIMGSDCGGTTKLNCEAQNDASDCTASGECKWRAATEVKILEKHKCVSSLPKVDPGTRTSPPADFNIQNDRAACQKKGGEYVDYVASSIYSPTFADCLAPGPCPVMTSGADNKAGDNEKICNEKTYCKYVPAKIIPAAAKCVAIDDHTLDCDGKTTKEECSGLAIVIGEEAKPLCKFKQTEPARVKEPAKCIVKSPNGLCPEVPITTVAGNKDDCEATEGCVYTVSGFISNATCAKHSCLSSSVSVALEAIESYRGNCEKISKFCDYQAPKIEPEYGVCSDVISAQ